MADSPRLAELRRRLHADPRSLAFAALAEELRRAGAWEEAIDTCVAGLVHHPDYASARVTLGRALLGAGQLDAAREELEAVTGRVRENLVAQRALIEAYRALGLVEAALDRCRLVQSLAPEDLEVADLLAELAPPSQGTAAPPAPEPVAAADLAPDAGGSETFAFGVPDLAPVEADRDTLPAFDIELDPAEPAVYLVLASESPEPADPDAEPVAADEADTPVAISDEPETDWPLLLCDPTVFGDAVAGPDAPSDTERTDGTGFAGDFEAANEPPHPELAAAAAAPLPDVEADADKPPVDLVVAFDQALDLELGVGEPATGRALAAGDAEEGLASAPEAAAGAGAATDAPADGAAAGAASESVENALERFLAAIRRERGGPPVDLAS